MAQVWESVLIFGTAVCLTAHLQLRPDSEVLLASVVAAVLIAPSVQIACQWERAVVLRFGKFLAIRKAGVLPMPSKRWGWVRLAA